MAWEKAFNRERSERQKDFHLTKVLRSKLTKRITEQKRPVRTLTVHQPPGLGHRQDVHLARNYSRSCRDRRSNRAQGSEQFLIVRGVGLVYVREHRSNVRTIEQILFKYSRDKESDLNGLYRLPKFFVIQYGLYRKREGRSIPSAFLQVQRERSISMWLTQFFIFQKLVTRPTIPFLFCS